MWGAASDTINTETGPPTWLVDTSATSLLLRHSGRRSFGSDRLDPGGARCARLQETSDLPHDAWCRDWGWSRDRLDVRWAGRTPANHQSDQGTRQQPGVHPPWQYPTGRPSSGAGDRPYAYPGGR